MATRRISREDAVVRLADVFRTHGYEGASLALLSDATGLGRASLYHHFPGGKEEMARAVFAHIGAAVQAELLAPLAAGGPPRERLQRFVRGLERLYAGGRKNCLLGAMVLGGGMESFAPEVGTTFGLLISTLEGVAGEVGWSRDEAHRRAEDAVVRLQGALILSRGMAQEGPFQRFLRNLPDDLLGASESRAPRLRRGRRKVER